MNARPFGQESFFKRAFPGAKNVSGLRVQAGSRVGPRRFAGSPRRTLLAPGEQGARGRGEYSRYGVDSMRSRRRRQVRCWKANQADGVCRGRLLIAAMGVLLVRCSRPDASLPAAASPAETAAAGAQASAQPEAIGTSEPEKALRRDPSRRRSPRRKRERGAGPRRTAAASLRREARSGHPLLRRHHHPRAPVQNRLRRPGQHI